MSDWHVEVVEIKEKRSHGNADSLEVVMVEAYPVITKLNEFQIGDKAVYIPINSMVPFSDPRFKFLDKDSVGKTHHRIKAIRLRGVFSMGLLVAADPDMQVGENVAERMGILRYDPPERYTVGGENAKDNPDFVRYTDIESYRKHHRLLELGEPIVVTEKIHGANSRYSVLHGEFIVGSHNCIKRETEDNLYWKIARGYSLKEKLESHPDMILFGEIFGPVQNLQYGFSTPTFRAFDVFDATKHVYLDWVDFVSLCKEIDIPIVPILYEGEWKTELLDIPETQKTHVNGVDQIMEGIVIRPVVERFDHRVGRVILKHVGETYLLR